MSGTQPQALTDRYFDDSSAYWREVYERQDVESVVYRRRMQAVLRWVSQLELHPGAKVLEVGCGAGLLIAELARGGLHVSACDSSEQMVEQARAAVDRAGLRKVVVVRADAHELPFAAGSFELVVALGLLPWLHDGPRAVREMVRVLAPGGRLILTADNALRLNLLTEPRESPLAAPVRLLVRRIRHRSGPANASRSAPSRRHRPAEVLGILRRSGLEPELQTTVGFGPFTFMGRQLLPRRLGAALEARLARLAARHAWLLRHGWHYVVAARRPG